MKRTQDKEIFHNITVLNKYMIPSSILTRLVKKRKMADKQTGKRKEEEEEPKFVINGRRGPILYRRSSIERLVNNDSMRYEESVGDIVREWKNTS